MHKATRILVSLALAALGCSSGGDTSSSGGSGGATSSSATTGSGGATSSSATTGGGGTGGTGGATSSSATTGGGGTGGAGGTGGGGGPNCMPPEVVCGTVASTPLAGGPITLVATSLLYPIDVAVDDGAIYWTTYGDGTNNGTVMKLAK